MPTTAGSSRRRLLAGVGLMALAGRFEEPGSCPKAKLGGTWGRSFGRIVPGRYRSRPRRIRSSRCPRRPSPGEGLRPESRVVRPGSSARSPPRTDSPCSRSPPSITPASGSPRWAWSPWRPDPRDHRIRAGAETPSPGRCSGSPRIDGRAIPLVPPKGGATALIFYSTECPISNAYSPTLKPIAERVCRRAVPTGRRLRRPRPDRRRGRHARQGLQPEIPGRPRPRRLARRQARGQGHARGVRPRRRRQGPLSRAGSTTSSPRRGKRNANPVGQRAEGRDRGGAGRQGGGRRPTSRPSAARSPSRPRRPLSRPTPRTSPRSSRRTARNATGPARSGRSRWRPTSRPASGPTISPTVVEDRRMPPWKADPTRRPAFKHSQVALRRGDRHHRRLGRGRRPRRRPGRPAPRPRLRRRLGPGTPTSSSKPRRGLRRSRPTGDDIYRCFVVPTNLPRGPVRLGDRVPAGNRRVVHHILAYVDTSGQGPQARRGRPRPGLLVLRRSRRSRSTATSAAGPPATSRPACPTASAGRCPSKADVIIQVHYHPSGKPETDRTRIGLHFAKKPVKQILHWSRRHQPRARAPARQSTNYRGQGRAVAESPSTSTALAVTPHMHLLGRDMHHVGHLPRRPRPGPDQDRRLGLQLAVHLPLREAARPAQGLGPQRRRALRQLGDNPATRTSRPSS